MKENLFLHAPDGPVGGGGQKTEANQVEERLFDNPEDLFHYLVLVAIERNEKIHNTEIQSELKLADEDFELQSLRPSDEDIKIVRENVNRKIQRMNEEGGGYLQITEFFNGRIAIYFDGKHGNIDTVEELEDFKQISQKMLALIGVSIAHGVPVKFSSKSSNKFIPPYYYVLGECVDELTFNKARVGKIMTTQVSTARV